ncbi:YHS domain-containing protein, partial [Rhizobiaceae sp. 2RAB30]
MPDHKNHARHDHSGHAHHGHSHGGAGEAGHGQVAEAAQVVRDPVCGMTVDPAAGKPTATYDGHSYHFCSASCREKFMK